MSTKADFGLVGLGVMGRNFILNVASHGFSASGLDRDQEKCGALDKEAATEKYVAKGYPTAKDFVESLKAPRVIMMLVPAGAAVDSVINDLLPHLSKGDLVIDGGNSFYTDTDRREKYCTEKGIFFIGAGVSGGSKGARFGPSIMPGGAPEAYALVKPIFEACAAKVNGEPCVTYIGPRSAGNYVKMVHNGIEYGMMQLLSETYDIMKRVLKMPNEEIQATFAKWNQGKLQSFLVEITSKIFLIKDDITGGTLVDYIQDKGKQKGTGKWTSQNAMDLGVPLMTVDASVAMRIISAYKSDRIEAEKLYPINITAATNKEEVLKQLEDALYFSFIMSYAQGMSMLADASEEYQYKLNLAEIAKIWRGGCIIRAALLEDITQAFKKNASLKNLLLDANFVSKINSVQGAARSIVGLCVTNGIPASCLSASISYFDAMRTGRLALNLVQAQRDFFGSHTYERTDKEGTFHTEWE